MPCLSIRSIFLLLAAAVLIFGLTTAIYAEGLSSLEESIKAGNINEDNNQSSDDLPTSEINKSNSNQVKKLKLAKSIKIKAKQSKIKFLTIAENAIKKLKKLEINSLTKLKQFKIPQIIKNRKLAKRIGDIAKLEIPKRVDESENPPLSNSIIIPSPEKDFGFPIDKNDKIRISGEVEVQRLYELACSTGTNSSENAAIIQEMKTIANGIYSKYNKYPDLCAISKLYLLDAETHLGMPGEFSNGTLSPNLMVGTDHRDYFKRYLQIMTDYSHETDKPNISKLIIHIYNNRIEKILQSDQSAQVAIDNNLNQAEKDMTLLYTIINETAYTASDENTVKNYVKTVSSLMSSIVSDYNRIYYFSVMTNNYETAESFFNSEYKDGKFVFSGVIKDLYDSIPKEVPFNYIIGYNAQNKPIIKTKMVEIYKEPAYIIEAINNHRNAELLRYNNTFLDDENNTNLTQKKVKAISEWLKNYEPDKDGINGAPEKMSQTDVDNLHNTAYGPNDYYKNSHAIKKIYFTRNENVELIDDIPHPSDFINIRAEVEAAGPSAPFYEYKIKLVNVNEPERYKQIRLSKDYISGGYYSKFQPNETSNTEDNTKNLINNGKDAQKDSIAAAECVPELFSALLVYDCKYFKKIMGYGYFNQMTTDPIKKIIKLSIPFLKSGGFEYVRAKMNTLEALVLVRNQADWLLIAGHGNEATGSIGMEDHNSLSDVIVRPTSDVEAYNETLGNHTIFGLLRKDGTSEYDEDIDVLILSVCSILKRRQNIDAWHNVLPDGLILGYCGKAKTLSVNNVIKQIYYFLTSAGQPVSKALILQKWKEFNLLEIISFVSIFTSKYDGILSYAYITNNSCVQYEAKRVPLSKYTPFLAGKIITMKKIIKLK